MAYKCLMVEDGLIVLVPPVYSDLSSIRKLDEKDVSIQVVDFGFIIKVGELKIPVPEILIDYLIANNVITLYQFNDDDYVGTPVLGITLSKEALLEAKGMYRLLKMQNETNKGN